MRRALAYAGAVLLLAGPAAADSSHAAADVCGGRGVRKVGFGVFNPDRRRTRVVNCVLPATTLVNSIGALANIRGTLGGKNRPFACTLASYDAGNTLVESTTSAQVSAPGPVTLVVRVFSSGFSTASGFYGVSCSLPPRSRLESIRLDEG